MNLKSLKDLFKQPILAPALPTPQSLGRELCGFIFAQITKDKGYPPVLQDTAELRAFTKQAGELVKAGAALDIKCGTGAWQPLRVAAFGGYEELVKLLIKAGAKLEDADNPWCRTPAQEAARYAAPRPVAVIIEDAIAQSRAAQAVVDASVILQESLTLPSAIALKKRRAAERTP